MKKCFLILFAAVSLFFTSCLSTTQTADTYSNKIIIPDTTSNAVKTIAGHEKALDYYFKFNVINYGNAICEITIYDKMYMKMEQPETGAKHYYYYKFTGDLQEGFPQRSGIFGYACDIENGDVYEIVFKNNFVGGYKFRSISDYKKNDRRYADGYITWNKFADARIPEPLYFLDFFEKKDKKLTSRTDEYGHKKDLAEKVYWSKSLMEGYKAGFKGDNK